MSKIDKYTTTKRKDIEVFETDNYSQFKFFSFNRNVTEKHVEYLAAVMIENGFDEAKPIEVTKDMYVVDGQHRLKAAERAGVPVLYQIVDIKKNHIAESIVDLNLNVKKYTDKEYFKLWVERKSPEYLRLDRVLKRYDSNVSEALFIMSLGTSGHRKFMRGEFEFTDKRKKYLVTILQQLHDVCNMNPGTKILESQMQFRRALLTIIKHPEYDHPRMLRKLRSDGYIPRCRKKSDYVRALLDKYNNGLRKSNRVLILS